MMLNLIKGLLTSKKMPTQSQQHDSNAHSIYIHNITLSAMRCVPAGQTHGIPRWNSDTLPVILVNYFLLCQLVKIDCGSFWCYSGK